MRLDAVRISLGLVLLVNACGDDSQFTPTDGPRADARADARADGSADSAVDAPPADGSTDGSIGPSAQIAAARAAADGPVTLPIDGALVTYLVPAIGTDPAGFFVQAEATGPALFIAVDPATLTPAPAVGDQVSFTITQMGTAATLRQAVTITTLTVASSGNDTSGLVQDVSSAADLVSALDNYDSELIRLSGTLSSGFASAGGAHVSAQVDTAAIMGDAQLKLRVPTTVRDALDLTQGCQVTVQGTPLWRFNTTAQPSGWVAGDIRIDGCPAPQAVSAVPTAATRVVVTFDRQIDPASVDPAGSQFTFDNGLTASGATAAGTQVTVTTSAQSGATTYTATVAGTVTDTLGSGVDPAANTAMFQGFSQAAVLVINEVNPHITGGRDLLELLVVQAGNTANMRVEQGISAAQLVGALPSIDVAAGDIIVVHLNPSAAMGDETTSETTAKNENPVSSFAANYDTAWDVLGETIGTAGMTFGYRVVVLRAPDGSIQDAVAFANSGGSSNSAYPGDLMTIQTMGLWLPADCGGAACQNPPAPAPNTTTVSADWASVDTTTGTSIRRPAGGVDTNQNSDWSVGASSFGLPNP